MTGPAREYCVHWVTVVSAPDAEAAAVEALRIQRDPQSIATVFEVYPATDHHAHDERRMVANAGEEGETVDLWTGNVRT